ncbi:MAG TPA: ABC transporter ATP-binding protein [Arenicellales bacterium]|nr:ABC transporter ATP-binding protein [Arenicellales bacterium]
MSSEVAISLESVSKCYHSYRKPIHRLIQLFSRERCLYEEFWALSNVSMTVAKGETLGVVGRNGSGKSTLLQLIVGTLTPTSGSVRCSGRISAILELGAGFNPEFSGMENARLNAAIVGMSSDEIEERMSDIVSFSELGDFIHKPVKTYSSGMHIRLAFSVVINMNPDILVIDEALAVGDSRFQRKCYRKLDELRSAGTTILFVTHATDAVITHCDRAVFMEGGMLREIGEPKRVVNCYLDSLFQRELAPERKASARSAESPAIDPAALAVDPTSDSCRLRPWYNDTEYDWGEGAARIFDFLLLDEDGEPAGASVTSGSRVQLRMGVYFEHAQTDVVYGVTIKTVDGTTVFGTNTELLKAEVAPVGRNDTVHVQFDLTLALISAEYFFSLGVISRNESGEENVLHRRYDLFRIEIHDDKSAFGYARLPAAFSVLSTAGSGR